MGNNIDTTSKEFDEGKFITHMKVLFKVHSLKIVKLTLLLLLLSHFIMSNSVRPQRQYPTRLL